MSKDNDPSATATDLIECAWEDYADDLSMCDRVMGQARVYALLGIAAAVRESSGSDPVLRARALTAERALAKGKGDRDAENEAWAARVDQVEAERDRARDAAVRLENELDAAHERADRLQRDFDAAVALSERRQTLLEDGLRLDRDATYKAVEDGVMDAWRHGRRLPRDFYKAIMDRLDGVLPMAEQADARPTHSDLRDTIMRFIEDENPVMYAGELDEMLHWVERALPNLVRPDDPAPTEQDEPVAITVNDLDAVREWSRETFGPSARTNGVTAHIAKELDEVRANPTDVEEWADVIILGFDGAWRSGAEPAEVLAAIHAKWAKNRARTWPDWRTASEDQPIEHDRTTEQDDTPSEWAPGTDITDRVESGDFPPRGTWVKASDPHLGDLSLYRKETGTMWSVGLAARFPIGPLDGITLTVATQEDLAAAGIEVAK